MHVVAAATIRTIDQAVWGTGVTPVPIATASKIAVAGIRTRILQHSPSPAPANKLTTDNVSIACRWPCPSWLFGNRPPSTHSQPARCKAPRFPDFSFFDFSRLWVAPTAGRRQGNSRDGTWYFDTYTRNNLGSGLFWFGFFVFLKRPLT